MMYVPTGADMVNWIYKNLSMESKGQLITKSPMYARSLGWGSSLVNVWLHFKDSHARYRPGWESGSCATNAQCAMWQLWVVCE